MHAHQKGRSFTHPSCVKSKSCSSARLSVRSSNRSPNRSSSRASICSSSCAYIQSPSRPSRSFFSSPARSSPDLFSDSFSDSSYDSSPRFVLPFVISFFLSFVFPFDLLSVRIYRSVAPTVFPLVRMVVRMFVSKTLACRSPTQSHIHLISVTFIICGPLVRFSFRSTSSFALLFRNRKTSFLLQTSLYFHTERQPS